MDSLGQSKQIYSDQKSIHEDLKKIVQNYITSEYLRPIDPKVEAFVKSLVVEAESFKGIIIDSCCGIGESSFHLSLENPEYLILGVDKSESRLSRNNKFKQKLPPNIIFRKGNMLDYWLAFKKFEDQLNIKKIYILFPNPYPKKSQLKKSWHAHPIIETLFSFACEIELRTNWEIYNLEFASVSGQFSRKIHYSGIYQPEKTITPFERKYKESLHNLYRSCISPL